MTETRGKKKGGKVVKTDETKFLRQLKKKDATHVTIKMTKRRRPG